jgi:signal transduction histidine kinase
MSRLRVSQFKLVLSFSVALVIAVTAYVMLVVVEFHSSGVSAESNYLARYTERALSRYYVNPQIISLATEGRAIPLGNDSVNLAVDYSQLKQRFPSVPPQSQFNNYHPRAVLMDFRGLFQTPLYLLVLPVEAAGGKTFYTYKLVGDASDGSLSLRILEKIQPALFVALTSILMVIVVELFHIARMNTNISEFANWASQLSAAEDAAPLPQFSSEKFNYMAYAINKNLSGINEVLEREQSFAKFTSHELRTPIAVLSANMELLELMMKDLSPQERKVLENMESAVSDMKYQMEALLWLSREADADVEYKVCSLRDYIDKAVVDNAYLIEGKSVRVVIDGEGGSIKTNPVFLQIILNNLLRNAYQNTDYGQVTITLSPAHIMLENMGKLAVADGSKPVGFGIGLVLVEKLVARLNISYRMESLLQGRRVHLSFPN